MNEILTPLVFGLLIFCVVAEIGRELNFKAAANGAAEAPSYVVGLAKQPWLWAGIGLWAVEVVAWILVLERAPLAIAYPIMTLTYAGVPLAGAMVLGERLNRRQLVGSGLVMVGVVCVALSGT